MPAIHRRRFLRRAGAAALGAAAGLATRPRPAASQETKPVKEPDALPIVDTHQHLWDLTKLRLPWLAGAGPLNRNHVMKDYLAEAAGLGIVKTVYMEVDVHDDDRLKEAEYVLDLCRRKDNPMAAAVIGGRPAEDGFKDYIARFKGSLYIKGVRHIPRGGKTDLWSEKPFLAGVRLLGELGMSFDLCMPPQGLADAAKLVDACPDTRFVLDHCGNADPQAFRPAAKDAKEDRAGSHDPDQWRRDMAALAKRDRVVCKISGIVARADKDHWKPDDLAPIVLHCIEAFGPDRVIFASDWPVCTRVATLRQWVGALKEIVRARTAADNKKLFHDNAVKFYGLT